MNRRKKSKKLEFVITPVSYTHLDVYKRQLTGRRSCSAFLPGLIYCCGDFQSCSMFLPDMVRYLGGFQSRSKKDVL